MSAAILMLLAQIVIRDEGAHVCYARYVDFVGAGVTATCPAGVGTITIPGGAGGTPASTVTDETTLGIAPAVGIGTDQAREDHTHGSVSEATIEAAVDLQDLQGAVTDAQVPNNITIDLAAAATLAATASIALTGDSATGFFSAGEIEIARGGTGQATAQAAIDALTAVAGATNEHVLTKDTASGNAIFKAAAGGTPSGWTDDGSIVRLTTSTDQVGIGTATPDAGLGLHAEGKARFAGIITNADIAESAFTINPTFNGAGTIPIGLLLNPIFTPSANISSARGYSSVSDFSPPVGVTITNAYSAFVGFNKTGAGTVTNSHTLFLTAPSGTSGTHHGLHVENQGAAGITTSYGLRVAAQSGSTTNYAATLGGKVGVNTETPAAMLAVNGGVHVGGDSDPGDNNLLVDGTLEVTGVTTLTTDLGIASGGTGQSTATNAFDALAPTTTQGDIIYHDGTDNVRLAKGLAGQHLRMNAAATAPEWGPVDTVLASPIAVAVSASYVTVFTVQPLASKTNALSFTIFHAASANTIGMQFRVRSADAGNVGGCNFTHFGINATVSSNVGTFTAAIAIAAAPADSASLASFTTAFNKVQIDCGFTSDGTPGTVILEAQLETGTTSTNILAGSSYTYITN